MSEYNVIEIHNLSKIFYDFWGRAKVRALDDLSFHVKQGEIFGLLGPNGSGKSTTIKILLGLLFPTFGKVSVFGSPARNVSHKQKIGFLPEESYLYPYQNAEEALTFYGRLFNLPHKVCQQRVDNLLEMVGLTRVRKRLLKEYSKGMARRIGIAQALINDPQLIILDEPTSGLDPIGTREIKDVILQLKEHGKTVLLCSHLLADVEDLCDRVTILYGGKQACEGQIGELLSNQEVTQVVSERLPSDKLEKLKDWFEKENIALHSVGNPTERLESFFLKTIEKARNEQKDAHGADAGRRVEGLFTDVEKTPEKDVGAKVLDSLVKKKETRESEEDNKEESEEIKSANQADTSSKGSSEGTKVIANLLKIEKPVPEVGKKEKDPSEPPKNNEVLSKLLKKNSGDEEENEK